MDAGKAKQVARNIFQRIQDSFPALRVNLILTPGNVDMSLEIPIQTGMAFPVNLNLQRDELHLNAGHFWAEWFPCTEDAVSENYFNSVRRLISGEYRIVETYRYGRAVGAVLEKPNGTGWIRLTSWKNFWIAFPGKSCYRVLQNKKLD